MASESKPFQSRSKVEIPGRARWEERLSCSSKLKHALPIDSDAELFMYLIQCIMFGFFERTNFLAVQPVYTEPLKFCYSIVNTSQYKFLPVSVMEWSFYQRRVITRRQAFTAQTVQKRAWFRCLQESASKWNRTGQNFDLLLTIRSKTCKVPRVP